MKDNLFEMVNDGNEEIPGTVTEEAQTGMEDGILTFDKPEPDNVPPIEKEVINESTQMVPYGNQITILEEELQPKTEDDLISITDKLYKAATSGLVITYYHIEIQLTPFIRSLTAVVNLKELHIEQGFLWTPFTRRLGSLKSILKNISKRSYKVILQFPGTTLRIIYLLLRMISSKHIRRLRIPKHFMIPLVISRR